MYNVTVFFFQVLKSYCEEPFHAEEDGDKKNDYEEQMMDLKKEVLCSSY